MLAMQCRMARAALGITVRQAADLAGVSHDTIIRIEGGQELKDSTVQKVRAAFESQGIKFTNGSQPGVAITHPDGTKLDAPASLGKRL